MKKENDRLSQERLVHLQQELAEMRMNLPERKRSGTMRKHLWNVCRRSVRR